MFNIIFYPFSFCCDAFSELSPNPWIFLYPRKSKCTHQISIVNHVFQSKKIFFSLFYFLFNIFSFVCCWKAFSNFYFITKLLFSVWAFAFCDDSLHLLFQITAIYALFTLFFFATWETMIMVWIVNVNWIKKLLNRVYIFFIIIINLLDNTHK